ncbi:phosphotransferase [Phycicoccus avicenniae]|uniref:phosphotransferase n=1 Tax=Phycicoccus avicenniae TaxID=2828860 RepID=UPI003D2A07FC
MDRSPSFLAALASAAVPGLDPVSVEALPTLPGQHFDVAFVQDREHRRWVVRAPRTDVAGAEMDRAVALLGLLARRLPFAVPAPKGFVALGSGGRAAVYPFLPGHPLELAALPPGPGLAAELGRALAALHNTDPALFEEAGLPSYDADAYRTRRLTELDRAAETGRVPTSLLARWEKALEDVTLWRFAAVPTHGDLTGEEVLAVFDDERDASTGRVKAVTGWEDAKVADPADDFAALVSEAEPDAVETVLEAYAHARVERPDANLLVRARLYAELRMLTRLMDALTRKDVAAVEVLATQLRRLDDTVHAAEESDDDYRRTSLAPVTVRTRPTPPPALVVDEDDDDEPLPEVARPAPPAWLEVETTGSEPEPEPEPATDEVEGDGAEDDTDDGLSDDGLSEPRRGLG